MNTPPANDVGHRGEQPFPGGSNDRDIEDLKARILQLETQINELERLTHIDPLVELANRRSIFQNLEQLIASFDRTGGHAAIIFVDVDGLKKINDRHGHAAGDAALVNIAQTLVRTVRRSDVVGRLSGDEFIIILPEADELGGWNMALRIAEATMASPLWVNDCRVDLSVAVGVSTVAKGDRPTDVISRADQAMYKIKAI